MARFVEGRLTGEDLAGFHEHVGACPVCSATLAALSRSCRPSSTISEVASSISRGDDSHALDDWLEQPAIAGRYRPLEVLGAGAMGIVYLAQDIQLNRSVALKITRGGVSQGCAMRLLREAQAMARLSHCNVLTVHDVGIWRDHVFVAMEYVKGGTLARHLLEQRRPWQEIVDKFVQAGCGLAEAHRAGLVHRDFKPENVLVSEAGDIRVADFGLVLCLAGGKGETSISAGDRTAKSAPPDMLRVRLTRAGTLLGTPAYMAPEQARGQPVDHRADIWSFCAALYEALYCELPFPGRTPHEVLEHVELGSIRRPPVGSDVPSWLRHALLRGLHADPAKRYARMDDLLALLTAGARGRALNPRTMRATALVASVVVSGALLVWRPGGKREDTLARLAITATSSGTATGLQTSAATAERSDSPGEERAASWSTQRAERATSKPRAGDRAMTSPSKGAVPMVTSERISVESSATPVPHKPQEVSFTIDADPMPATSGGQEPVGPRPTSGSQAIPGHGAPIIRD